MAKTIRIQNKDVSDFVRLLTTIAPEKHTIEVFSDWCKCSAYAFANAARYSQERENAYLETINKYNRLDRERFAKMLAVVAEGLTNRFCDFLGEVYMSCNMGNGATGQFFTPYSVSQVSAAMSIGEVKDKDRIISFGEPSCGSGGMIVAAAEHLQKQGFPFQQNMIAFMGDLDINAVYMSMIQCSLLGIPAVIQHTNTLTMEVYDEFETPACAMFLVRERYESQQARKDAETVLAQPQAVEIEPTVEIEPSEKIGQLNLDFGG